MPQHKFEIAEYSNGMDCVRLFMTQSRLEVIGKQIRYFMCRDAFFAQMICVEGMLKISCLALVFSRLERGPEPLVLCPMIVNWLLNPTAYFETTFSSPDTFQEQF